MDWLIAKLRRTTAQIRRDTPLLIPVSGCPVVPKAGFGTAGQDYWTYGRANAANQPTVGARHAVPEDARSSTLLCVYCSEGAVFCTAGLRPAFLNFGLKLRLQMESQRRRPEASGTITEFCKHVLDGHAVLTPHSGTACRAPTEEKPEFGCGARETAYAEGHHTIFPPFPAAGRRRPCAQPADGYTRSCTCDLNPGTRRGSDRPR